VSGEWHAMCSCLTLRAHIYVDRGLGVASLYKQRVGTCTESAHFQAHKHPVQCRRLPTIFLALPVQHLRSSRPILGQCSHQPDRSADLTSYFCHNACYVNVLDGSRQET
jgi:hypothetical protein